MTVKQLKEKLEGLPDDLLIVVSDGYGGMMEADTVEVNTKNNLTCYELYSPFVEILP